MFDPATPGIEVSEPTAPGATTDEFVRRCYDELRRVARRAERDPPSGGGGSAGSPSRRGPG